jgi:DNA/RNA endonuclease G (NUC1)
MRWAAWRANREYRVTPPRKGVLETFRSEPSITEVSYSDYVGWYDSELNFARGHMVPYFISGGDRDNDGEYAVRDPSASKPFDEYDACAVFQVNSMANIVPQRHEGFNGIGGAWNLLETDIRHLVDDGWEFNVIAGTVFVGDDVEFIHPINNSSSGPEIAVPHGFFKIVVHRPTSSAVAFLYDHTRDIPGGCKFRKKGRVWPSSCIVPIPRIEELTGLSFFGDLPSHQRRLLRETSSTRTWFRWLNSLEQY